jgi:predicted Zn-dependent protease
MKYLILSSLSLLLAYSCQTSPLGRKQLALVSDDQMNTMGEQAFAELKAKQPIEGDPKTNQYVRCVANAVTNALPEKQNWEVVVFQDGTANAFALPGGKIGVHTGILKVAKNQDQLATVIGHEVSHVLAEHSKERVSEQLAAQGGLTILDAVLGNKDDPRHNLLMGALGLGAEFGVLLPHSRDQESEADLLGLDLMAKAGFDPRQSVQLWKNMEDAGGEQPPEFLSTHPSNSTRMENLEKRMPQALELKAQSKQHPNCKP